MLIDVRNPKPSLAGKHIVVSFLPICNFFLFTRDIRTKLLVLLFKIKETSRESGDDFVYEEFFASIIR
jgi:hypothetical protein